MTPRLGTVDQLVTALIPSLSRSLTEQFNVFRVMHHGTHEKQISNVFAWLLQPDETHELGDTFQRIFLSHVNEGRDDQDQLPAVGYLVLQEVDTSGESAPGKDIADIVLRADTASVVIENFGTSDGHGHDYQGYLSYGAIGERVSVVVLLCIRHEPALQRDGWENATVITYADLLTDLQSHVNNDARWRKAHPQQNFFLNQLMEHFVETPQKPSTDDHLTFIKAMCETGESDRYGHRPQDAAATEFAELVAQHAKHQFEEGRRTLGAIKRKLRQYAEQHIVPRVNEELGEKRIAVVLANFQGQWEWYIRLLDAESGRVAGLLFGPTAAANNGVVQDPIENPDFSKVFVLVGERDNDTNDHLIQTDVGLGEILAGLESNDLRLTDAIVAVIRSQF